jgi:hypothetical protein
LEMGCETKCQELKDDWEMKFSSRWIFDFMLDGSRNVGYLDKCYRPSSPLIS